jgi:hypothetical protein
VRAGAEKLEVSRIYSMVRAGGGERPAALLWPSGAHLPLLLQRRKAWRLSNLIKAVEDGLQFGGVIENDRQVIRYGPGTGIYYAQRGKNGGESAGT